MVCILIIWSSGFADPNAHSNKLFLPIFQLIQISLFFRFVFNRTHQINLNGLK